MTVWRPSPLVRAQWTRKNVIFPENQAIKSPFLSLKLLWRAWRVWILPLSDLHRSFQVEFISIGFRAGAVSRVPGGSFRYWNTKSNFKANTEWWAGSVCNHSTPNFLFACFYPWRSIAEQASEQPLDISASARPRHESFFVSLGKDEALSNTNPGKPIPAWLVSNLPAGGETRVLQR